MEQEGRALIQEQRHKHRNWWTRSPALRFSDDCIFLCIYLATTGYTSMVFMRTGRESSSCLPADTSLSYFSPCLWIELLLSWRKEIKTSDIGKALEEILHSVAGLWTALLLVFICNKNAFVYKNSEGSQLQLSFLFPHSVTAIQKHQCARHTFFHKQYIGQKAQKGKVLIASPANCATPLDPLCILCGSTKFQAC